MRVAALADVHGNAAALAAVLEEVERERPDVVVFCGDLTWGPQPFETLGLVRALDVPTRFVRGNADRRLLELHAGTIDEPGPRDRWLADAHRDEDVAFLDGFEATVTLDVDGLGPTCFAHGSPRSDVECVTELTPLERVRELLAGVDATAVVTAHVHVSYERRAEGVTFVGPGSVGIPYEGRHGARWALLGPGVELRCTEYDVEAAAAAMRATGDPDAERIAGLLLEPPSREDVIRHAEDVVFAD